MPKHLILLLLAILSEVTATTALAASQQFTRLGPSLIVVLGYGLSFYLLSATLKVMPVGIVYAIWSGLGVVGVGVLGYVLWGQKLDAAALLGIALILTGVAVINLFSGSAGH